LHFVSIQTKKKVCFVNTGKQSRIKLLSKLEKVDDFPGFFRTIKIKYNFRKIKHHDIFDNTKQQIKSVTSKQINICKYRYSSNLFSLLLHLELFLF
jgi:hypothetical protein